MYGYVDRYDIIETFEVISITEGGYLVKVPARLFLSNSILINESRAKEYSIPKNFMGVMMHFVTDSHVYSIKSRKDGESCDRCKEFFPMAARGSNGEFKCFLCRTYPHR